MEDKTRALADALVREKGLAEARTAALAETLKAQQAKDYYWLSIWREVRHHLAEEPVAPTASKPPGRERDRASR